MAIWNTRHDTPPPRDPAVGDVRMVGGFACGPVDPACRAIAAWPSDDAVYWLLWSAEQICLCDRGISPPAFGMMLGVPRAVLDERGACLRMGMGEAGLAPLLIALAGSAYRQAAVLSPAQHRSVREALLALIIAAWGDAGRPVREVGLLQRVQRHILQNLHNPCLSPKNVARAEGLSVRHLHRLFAAAGISLGNWIRLRRLECCAIDLRDPSHAHETITEIAFRWGFSDSSGFSRAFRAVHGQTPRDYRRFYRKTPPVVAVLRPQRPMTQKFTGESSWL